MGSTTVLGGLPVGEAFRTPWSDRLFLSPRIMAGDFGAIDTYQTGLQEFPDDMAGTNDSSEDNFIPARARISGTDSSSATCSRSDTHGMDPIPTYVLDRGLLAEGSTHGDWNPLCAGRTVLEVEPFYRGQDYDADIDPTSSRRGNARQPAVRERGLSAEPLEKARNG